MKFSKGSLAGPDDPIFKEGPTFYMRRSDRASTPSTESSPKRPVKASGRVSKGLVQKASPPSPGPQEE